MISGRVAALLGELMARLPKKKRESEGKKDGRGESAQTDETQGEQMHFKKRGRK